MSISISAYTEQRRTTFKVVVVGERAVGKTSLAVRYTKGSFNQTYSVTVGIQFYSKVVSQYQEEYNLQIWDTAGQQSFRSLVRSFYNQASCIIIAYSDPQKVEKTLHSYLAQIAEHASEETLVFAVRTKIDQLQVTEQERTWLGDMVERKQIFDWMAVSSKEDTNVQEFFTLVTNSMIQKYQQSQKYRDLIDAKKLKDSIALTKSNQVSTQETSKIPSKKKRCCQ